MNDRSAFHAFEQAGWKAAADHYAGSFAAVTRLAIEPLLDAAGVTTGTRLLDLACGPGELSGRAARRGARVTGVDFTPEMLAIARERWPGVEFRSGDAQALEFPDASFDAVTMSFLLGHLAYPDRGLAEARRVLAPGGRFAASWWLPPDEALPFGIVRGAIQAHGRTDVGLPEAAPFEQFGDPASARAALVAAGFDSIDVRRHDMTWDAESPEAVFETLMRGGVRTAGLLRAQTPADLERIRTATIEGLARFGDGEGLQLPMPTWIMSGRVPSRG